MLTMREEAMDKQAFRKYGRPAIVAAILLGSILFYLGQHQDFLENSILFTTLPTGARSPYSWLDGHTLVFCREEKNAYQLNICQQNSNGITVHPIGQRSANPITRLMASLDGQFVMFQSVYPSQVCCLEVRTVITYVWRFSESVLPVWKDARNLVCFGSAKTQVL